MDGWGRDLRHTFRGLTRDRGTTLVIWMTLAVAIGSTTSIFAVADAAFLRPLPYPAADRLARVYSGSREDPGSAFALSPLDLRDLEGYDALVEDIGAWTVAETVHLTDGDEPRKLEAPRASAGLFRILGVKPELGRFFTPEEEMPGGDDAVVLSHGLWVSAFGGDPGVVRRSITLDGRAYRIVGVAPAGLALPPAAEAWRALALGPEWYDPGRWGWQFLAAVARLRPGVDTESASAALTRRLAESVPGRVERGQTRVVRTLYEERVGSTGSGVLLLLGSVGLLMVLACANVMNVVLARAERRMREFGLRRALGSGGAFLVRLVVLETGVLAILGGATGLGLAHLALRLLRATELSMVPYLGDVRVDLRVVGFTLLLAVVTAAAFGVVPVLRALRADPQAVLRESTTRAGSSRRTRRVQDGLVVAQVAIACTLLAAVGLSASAFVDLQRRDVGFRADGVLAASVELPAGLRGSEEVTYYRRLLERVRALPEVEEAGAGYVLPLGGLGWTASIELVDPDPAVTDPDPGGNMRPVTPGYLGTLEIPLVAGRDFSDTDGPGTTPVVIVDDVLARRYWPGGSPVGRRVHVGALSREAATIVGVVGSVPDESLASPPNGTVYFPVFQSPQRNMTLVVRTARDPASLAPAVRAAIHETDPRVPVTDLSALEARIRRTLAAPRTGLLLLAALGAVALILAAVGIYGVLAYAVAQRTGEIGTRMALGAAPSVVRGEVVRQAMRLWVVGALVGSAGALGTAVLLTRYVYGVQVGDPVPYAVAFAALGSIALLAALVPAARATAVDPAGALRTE